MRTLARRHHYLPQGYLAGFTDNREKEGKLCVLEIETGRGFRTSPKNVAVERDFNRIDVDGKDPDVLEQALGAFEDHAIRALRRVAETNALPQDDDFSYLINLLCLFAIRNPQLRNSFNRTREQVLRQVGALLVSNKKIWNHHVTKAREAEEQIPDDVSFEDFKSFVESGDYRIEVGTDENLRVEFNTFDKLLPYLGRRLWSLMLADDSAPDFICSDHPVTVAWKDRTRCGPIGFGLRQTEVVFPLNRRQALFGVFEDPLPVVCNVNARKVSELNARTALNAEKQVYCTTESFVMCFQDRLVKVNCMPDTALE